MRSAAFVVLLGLRRLRRRDGGALVAALGIAAAAAVLAGILVGATVAKDRSVSHDVERLPAAARSVRASWFGVPAGTPESWSRLDSKARGALARLRTGEPTSIALVRESTIGGVFVGIAAVDGLAPHVLLRSGRLPRSCRPERCEVLRLRGVGRLPDVPGLRVVQVGTGTLRSRQLFGDFLTPTDNALADAELAPSLAESDRYHRPAPGPLVVAEGVDGLVASPVLARSYRSYSWIVPLGDGAPRLWRVDGLVGDADRARAELQASSVSWSLSVPAQELAAARSDATVAGRRLLLVGGEAAALLVAFAVLAAGALRRDLASARRRLTWHGARRWQRGILTATESVVVGFGGAAIGWVVGCVAGAVAAALAGAPVGDVLSESALSPAGLALGLGVAALSALVIAVTVSLPPRPEGRALGLLELAAGLAIVAVLAVWASGTVDAGELDAGGTAPVVLLLLPGLVAFAAAVAASRLLPAAGRRLARRGGASARLAGVSLARSPGAAGIAAAFLALAVGLAVLAEAYRSTLSTGERDQAAYAVPTDVVVREDLRALVPVLRAAPLQRYEAIPGVESVHQVVRVQASAGPSAAVSGVTVLGVPQAAIRSMPLWRDDWGASRGALVSALTPGAAVALRGMPLAGSTLRVEVGPGLLSLRATIVLPDGTFRGLELGDADADRATVLVARLPDGARGGRLVSITLVPPRIVERGSDEGVALRGTTTLRIPGASLAGWLGEGGANVSSGEGGSLRVAYAVTPQRVARVRLRQPTDDDPPGAAVTRALADVAGGVGARLPLRIGGEPVNVTVAAVVERFPGTRGDAVIADLDALETAIDTAAPGRAPVSELWLDVAGDATSAVQATLEQRPFAVLEKHSRQSVEQDARRDPLGHGTLLALGAAAVAALLLAVMGLALAIRADLRDDRGELADLEAQGATPALLRRVVTSRAAVVALTGALVGAFAGIVLAYLVTRVVSVTARADTPEPPLATTVDPLSIVLGGIAVAVAAGALVALVTRRAFDDPRGPGRIGGET
jgi:hypothetical protein